MLSPRAPQNAEVAAETLAERLAVVMRAQNLDATALASRAGVQRQRIYDVLHGRTKQPTADFVDRVAEALGISYRYLIRGVEDSEASTVAALREDMIETVMRWAAALNRIERGDTP